MFQSSIKRPSQWLTLIFQSVGAINNSSWFQIAGVRFHVMDGAHHPVDSTEIAFINLAKGVMRDCFQRGQWVLTQPIMKVEVITPIEFQVSSKIQANI